MTYDATQMYLDLLIDLINTSNVKSRKTKWPRFLAYRVLPSLFISKLVFVAIIIIIIVIIHVHVFDVILICD